jgi:RHS repeat-associated protein
MQFLTVRAGFSQCVYGAGGASIPASGGTGSVYLSVYSECQDYSVSTNDTWFYVWIDYWQQTVFFYADPNYGGYRSGEATIYNSDGSTLTVYVSQDGCEQLPWPGEIIGQNTIDQNTVCASSSATFSISPLQGATEYHWELDGSTLWGQTGTTATINFTGHSSPVTIGVAGVDLCGNGVLSTKIITILGSPSISSQPSSLQVCEGISPIFSVTAQNASSYQWEQNTNGTWQIVPGATGSSLNVGIANSFMNGRQYRCQVINSCFSIYSNPATLTVNYIAAAGNIAGPNSVCAGQIASYSVNSIYGSTWNQWLAPSGVTIFSGQGTNSINVSFSEDAASGNISVQGTNSCGSGIPFNISVTVHPNPIPSITSNSPVCWAGALNLSTNNYSSYYWFGPNGFSSNLQSPSINNVSNLMEGNYIVNVTDVYGCSGSGSTEVSVRDLFIVNIVGGSSPVCYNGSPGALTANATGGTEIYTYQWYKDGIPTSTQKTYNPGPLSSSSTIYCSVTSGTCGTYNTDPINITVYPNLTATVIGGLSPICYDSSPGTFSVNAAGGTNSFTYQWYKNGSPTGTTTSTYNPGPLQTTSDFYCLVTSGSCTPVSSNVIRVIVRDPVIGGSITNSNAQTICYNTDAPILTNSSAASGGSNSFSYQWQSSNNGGSTWDDVPGATSISYDPPSLTLTTIFIRRATDNAGCQVVYSNPITVQVYQQLSPGSISGDNASCYGEPVGNIDYFNYATGGSNSYTYTWMVSNNGGASWSQIGGNTASLIVGDITKTSIFHRLITDNVCNTTISSNNVTKTVRDPINPGFITGEEILCFGANANIISGSEPSGGSNSFTYSWEMSDGPDEEWRVLEINSEYFDPENLYVKTKYRRIAIDGLCGQGVSNEITKNVQYIETAGSIKDNQTIIFKTKPEKIISLSSASGSALPLSYQWQYSLNGIDNWENISQATDLDYSPEPLSTTSYLRRFVTDNVCGSDYSNPVKISVINPNDGEYLTGKPSGSVGELVGNNGLVGEIPGQISVGPTGAAIYTIPIECPRGINDLTPKISLIYNSQSGDGIAGKGWNLSGLSAIRRIPKTLYNDNEIKSISWSESDNFALDGSKLIISHKYPGYSTQLNADSIEYKSEESPNIKVKGYRFSESGPEKFHVWLGDGNEYEYSQTQELSERNGSTEYYTFNSYPADYQMYSSENFTDLKKIAGWYLTKVTDKFGNDIIYNYEEANESLSQTIQDSLFYDISDSLFVNRIYEKLNGQQYLCNVVSSVIHFKNDFRLKEIIYANGTYKLKFNYETRSNPIISYISGAQIKNLSLLSSISVLFLGGTPTNIREYSLDYLQDLDYNLRKVGLSGLDNDKLNNTVFNWNNENYTYSMSSFIPMNGPTYYDSEDLEEYNYYPGDFNGDGMTDLLQTSYWREKADFTQTHKRWAVHYNTGQSNSFDFKTVGEYYGNDIIYIFDSDNDRKDEFYDSWFTTRNSVDYLRLECYRDSLNNFIRDENKDIEIQIPKSVYDVILVPGNFEGDGRIEYLVLKGTDLSLLATSGFTNCTLSNFGNSSSFRLTDVDGDSKQEIALLKDNIIEFWEYRSEYQKFVKESIFQAANRYDKIYFADFNADGNDDLLFYDVSMSSWKLYASTGTGFTTSITKPGLDATLSSGSHLFVGDVNSDGKADILEISDGIQLKVFVSKGTEFIQKLDISGIGDLNFIGLGNMDKDLANEIIMKPNADLSVPKYFNYTSGDGFGQIENITTGLGTQINIVYNNSPVLNRKELAYAGKNLNNEDNVSTISIPFRAKVVSSVQDDNVYHSYSFERPEFIEKGMVFLGYALYGDTLKKGNLSYSSLTVSKSIQRGNTGKYVFLADSSINYIDSNIITRTKNFYSSKLINSNHRVLPDSVKTEDLLNIVSTSKHFEKYNDYLLPEVTRTKIFGGSSLEAESVDTISYGLNSNGDNWLVGNVFRKKTILKRGNEKDFERTYNFGYYANGALKDEYTEKGSSHEVKKSYNYDSYGNVLKITTVAPADIYDSRSRIDSMIYSQDGRFKLGQVNPLGHAFSFGYNTLTGLLDFETDPNGITTKYFYDGFGNIKKKKSFYNTNLNIEESNSLNWVKDLTNVPEGSCFFSYSLESGQSPIIKFMNRKGLLLRTVTVAYNGNSINQDIIYDSSDRIAKESLPYFASENTLWKQYHYDSYNRIKRDSLPNGIIKNYSYQGRLTSVETISSDTTFNSSTLANSLGKIIESTDIGGNSIVTRYYASGQSKEIQISGQPYKTKFSYDIYGNRDTIFDPDAGTIISKYDSYGHLVDKIDNGKNTHYTYDLLGRILTETNSIKSVYYSYDNDFIGATDTISDGYNTITYDYRETDGFLESITENIAENNDDSKTLTTSYTYDEYGRVLNKFWSSGYQILNHYSEIGILYKITDASRTLWELKDINALGQINSFSQGTYVTNNQYDQVGYLQNINTGSVRNIAYEFNNLDNLISRSDNLTNQKEVFNYDGFNRLKRIDYYRNNTHIPDADKIMYYDEIGNITGKSGLALNGNIRYGEENSGPHALTSISDPLSYHPLNQSINYTDFRKVENITDTVTANSYRKLSIKYGVDYQRKKSSYLNGASVNNRYYFGDYEESIDGTINTKYFFIGSPTGLCAVYKIEGSSTGELFYIFTDHLGSLTEIVNASSGEIKHQSYDAWGNKRLVMDWRNAADYQLFAGRGFTGHEHLEDFDLINMNGRVYDPVLGRFLSPDPFVQLPNFSQSFNRYSYCLNNPLKYTDPSGNFVFSTFLPVIGPFLDAACWGAVIGAGGYTANVAFSDGGFNNWNSGQFWKSVGIGAISGVVTAGIGNEFGAVGSNGIGGELARAYTHGYANGVISELSGGDFMSGFVSGGLGSFGGSAFMMYGGRFASSTLGNYAFSGLAGGIGAEIAGGNFWEGAATGLMTAGLNHLQQGINRPNFDDMLANYPTDGQGGDMPASDVYNLIGGDVLSEHNRDPNSYNNACALRTSRALNYGGANIPYIKGMTLVGADGKNYFYRASDLYNWMSKPAVYGKPNISSSDFSKFAGNKGVFIMQANYPKYFGAWGHATLYNMTGCMGGHCYNGSYAYKYYLWNF